MKTLNAWAFAKWGTVLLIYGITVAIGLDQIRERDKRIAAMKDGIFRYMDSVESLPKTMSKSSKLDRAELELQKIQSEVERDSKDREIEALRTQLKSP